MTDRPANFEQSMAQETRQRIAKAMADGRWRTVNDLLPIVKAERGSVAYNCCLMAKMGLLVQERMDKTYLFRKAVQG
jgi:hypothetical protein